MNNLASALCGFINFMPPWIMLGVFGAIILLVILILALKGYKRVFFRVLVYMLVGLIPFSYLVYLGVQAVQAVMSDDGTEALLQLITFAISWGPTVFICWRVFWSLLRGIRRGLRKSLILTLHAVCAGAVGIAFFFIAVYVKEVDAGALKFVNLLAGENALQNMLGVTESCSTLKEVLAAYISSLLGSGFEGLSPYIYTLVDMAYRIVFGLVSLLIAGFIDFVLYIVYLLCYSQRKYKKNKMLAFKNGKTDRSYKKHWIGGGAVGLVRGVASGVLCLAFVGSTFFVFAGGKGEGKLEDHDFGNDEVNFYYQIYRSVESYGAQGIFKLLNLMSDSADTPFYLFAADLVFSGELNDEEFGISENVKFREEFATFTGFARDTFNLLLKYGPDEVNAIVNGEVTDNAFDTVLGVMTQAGFKEEFDSLIDAFDAQTYLINLSMSLVNTIVSNIDEISFTKDAVGEGEKELIKLIFKKGYLSENIPDERETIQTTGKAEAEGSDIRPYLTVNHLITKSDVKLVLNLVLSMLAGEETGDTVQLVKRLVPEISKLSILSSERKTELNPVLARMYCLFENLYLTEEGSDGVSYSEITSDNIDWIGEIHSLLDAVDDVLLLYNNLSAVQANDEEAQDGEEGEEGAGNALNILKTLFDEKDEHYTENMEAYDNICNLLTESKVIGRALSTSFVYKTVSNALLGVSENIYVPKNVSFGNTYDKDGKLISYGETYRLLYGVKLLFGKNAAVLDTLLNVTEDTPVEDILNVLSEAVETEDDKGNTLVNYLTESAILRSVISIELIEVGGNTFYVPQSAREKVDGEFVNLITEEELKGLLQHMTELADFVMPFVGDSTEWQSKIDDFLTGDNSDSFYNLVKSNRIFEGTVARLFTVKLGDIGAGVIVIPKALDGFDNIDGWITVDGKQGELLNLLDALRDTDFNVSDIILGGAGNEFNSSNVLQKITGMNEGELEAFFSSSVLHYTVSKYVADGSTVGRDFVLVIPQNSRQPLTDDSISYLIKKSELISVFSEISALGLDEDFSAESILIKIAKDKSLLEGSKIIPASIVATVVKNKQLADIIPTLYNSENMGSVAQLENYDSTNPWTKELPALIEALDELLGLQKAGDDFTFDVNFTEKISELLLSLNDKADIGGDRTKLDVLYGSVIFQNKITAELDKVLTGDIIEGEIRDSSYVKLNGYYRRDELQALSASANALGITSFNEGFTPDTLKDKLTVETLGTVYASTVVKGAVTKAVKNVIDGNGNIFDHPLAYETNLKVYKEWEIESILSVCGDLNGKDINLEKVSKYLYDGGVTKSYILVASITGKIIDHEGIIIPDTVVETVEGKPYVSAQELSLAVNAFLAYGMKDFEHVDKDMAISIPAKSARTEIFKSEIIRARITYQLITLNDGGVLAVKEGNAKQVLDVRASHSVGYTSVMSADQLEALAGALEIIYTGDTDFKIPDFSSAEQILKYSENLDTLLQSDIVLYRMCEYLEEAGNGYVHLETEDAFDLEKHEVVSGVSTASKEQILTYAQAIQNMS